MTKTTKKSSATCEDCETPLCTRCEERRALSGVDYCVACLDGLREDHEEAMAEARRESRMLGEE